MSFTILFDFFSFSFSYRIANQFVPSYCCLYIAGITILAAHNGISFFSIFIYWKSAFLFLAFLCSHLMLSLPPPLNFHLLLFPRKQKKWWFMAETFILSMVFLLFCLSLSFHLRSGRAFPWRPLYASRGSWLGIIWKY